MHLWEFSEDAVSGLKTGDRFEKDVKSGKGIFTPPVPMAEDRDIPATDHDCRRCCGADDYGCRQWVRAADTVAGTEFNGNRSRIGGGTNRPMLSTHQRSNDHADSNIAARDWCKPTVRNIACDTGGCFYKHCSGADSYVGSCSDSTRTHIHG